jgi:hypothetical protein
VCFSGKYHSTLLSKMEPLKWLTLPAGKFHPNWLKASPSHTCVYYLYSQQRSNHARYEYMAILSRSFDTVPVAIVKATPGADCPNSRPLAVWDDGRRGSVPQSGDIGPQYPIGIVNGAVGHIVVQGIDLLQG